MRLIIAGILAVFLTGCSDNCPEYKFRDYRHWDNVKVIAGFYKGYSGKIVERSSRIEDNNGSYCQINSFKVELDLPSGKQIKNISQYKLYVER